MLFIVLENSSVLETVEALGGYFCTWKTIAGSCGHEQAKWAVEVCWGWASEASDEERHKSILHTQCTIHFAATYHITITQPLTSMFLNSHFMISVTFIFPAFLQNQLNLENYIYVFKQNG